MALTISSGFLYQYSFSLLIGRMFNLWNSHFETFCCLVDNIHEICGVKNTILHFRILLHKKYYLNIWSKK